jgi:transposase
VSGSTPNSPQKGLIERLYLATLSAVRYDAWLRAFYRRLLARGKPKLLALTAAMRKLLSGIHRIAKRRQPFIVVATPQPT